MKRVTIHYRCRYCEQQLGTLPFKNKETIQKIHQLEIGEIDDYVDADSQGDIVVQCICEQCEQAMRSFPNYYAMKRWLQ